MSRSGAAKKEAELPPCFFSKLAPRTSIWIQHHLDAIILLVAKHIVSSGSFVELHAVGDHERGINLIRLDPVEQGLQITLAMGLSHAQGEAFAERRAERQLVHETAVNSWNRDCSALAASLDGFAQCDGTVHFQLHGLFGLVVQVSQRVAVRLHANSVNTAIWPDAAGHLF